MQKVIHKHLLNLGYTILALPPAGLSLRKIGLQRGQIHAWVERTAENEPHTAQLHLQVIPTGQPFITQEGFNYLDTVIDDERGAVWHIYGKMTYS